MEELTTPLSDGFFMPAEYAPQTDVWMAWPERSDNWRFGAKPAQQAFAAVACAIAEVTPVSMIVSAEKYAQARSVLPTHIRVIEMSHNDAWLRDTGPTAVINEHGERRFVSWKFNAWGGLKYGLYFPWDKDDLVAEKISELMQIPCYKAPFVLEGGAIHSDGEGTLYTTEECLLHEGRNPELSKDEIEQYLHEYLGASKVIWLPCGTFNDETNGHVDNILHVIGPAKVVVNVCHDKNDPQYALSHSVLEVLKRETDAKGRPMTVYELPMPGPLYLTEEEAQGIDISQGMKREAGERLAGSYTNFLITNGHIIFPLLDEKNDDKAIAILQEALPEYSIKGVPGREILLGGGNIHCITQHIPACYPCNKSNG